MVSIVPAHLAADDFGRGQVAWLGERHEVAERRHAVGAARTCVCRRQGGQRLSQVGHHVHLGLPQAQAQSQSQMQAGEEHFVRGV